MEDYALDVMIGKGPSARSPPAEPQAVHGGRRDDAGRPDQQPAARPVRGDVPARLLHGDGARPRSSSARRRSSASTIDDAAAAAIARRGRGTPRIVNRLLKRVRDHAQVHGDGHVDEATATAAMRAMEIDDEGLDSTDRKLLAAIIQKFASGRSASRRSPPSCPRRSRRSRTSTSRSCSASGSSIGRRRAGSRPTWRGRTWPASATRSRRRAGRIRRMPACGTTAAATTEGDDRAITSGRRPRASTITTPPPPTARRAPGPGG